MWELPFQPYDGKLKDRAKSLRRAMTKQERHLWYDFLRYYKVKFYKQRMISHVIVDFYCPSAKLVIELDGSQHFSEQGKAYDEERTMLLNKYGINVIRFKNIDVDRNFKVVCEIIDKYVDEQTSPSTRCARCHLS